MTQQRTIRQQQAEETRNRLIDSALKVFSRRGFTASTTKDIAKEAGVTDGLIYHYFKSKEDLMWEILEKHTLVHQIQQTLDKMNKDMELEVIVEHYVRSLFDILEENNDLIVLIFGEAQRNSKIRARLSMIVNYGSKPLATILKQQLNLDLDELLLAVRNLQFSIVQYYLIIYRSEKDMRDREYYIKATAHQFNKMLK